MLNRLVSRTQAAVSRLVNAATTLLGLGLILSLVVAGVAVAYDSMLGLLIAIAGLGFVLLHLYGIILALLQNGVTKHPPGPQSKPEPKKKITLTGSGITIVVPLYNEERFIKDCLESIKRQTWTKWECIIVDDASTDSGPSIAFEFADRDKRFSVARHFQNSGLSAARNTGLRLAKTDLVTFLDADDMLLQDSLSTRLAYYSGVADPALAGVFCGIWSVPEDATVDHQPPSRRYISVVKDSVSTQAECPFNAHAPIIRAELVRNVGGFDETMLFGAEDWDCWQRILRHGYYFESIPQIGALYRRKKHSMVRSLSTQHLAEAQRQYELSSSPFAPRFKEDGVIPFTHPVAEYPQAVKLTERVVSFAPMAYLANGEEGLAAALKHLPTRSGTYVERHLKLSEPIATGTQRALAIMQEPTNSEELRKYRDVITTVSNEVHRSLKALDASNHVEPIEPKCFDVIFYVLDSYEARLAVEQRNQVDRTTRQMAAIVPAAANDAQGARDILSKNDIEVFSINRYSFERPIADILLCFRQSGFGIADLQKIAQESGAAIFQLKSPIEIDVDDQVQGLKTVAALSEVFVTNQHESRIKRLDNRHIRELFRYPGSVVKLEERINDTPDYTRLAKLKDKHSGQRCVIIGNGPSLNKMDLRRIENEVTIGVNGIFYKTEESGFRPDYYVVEDSSVMKENIEAIRNYDVPFKLFPTNYRDLHPPGANVSFFRMNRGFYESTSENFCSPRFSTDFALRAYCGQSVTYINLQLAFFMGFSEVFLIGMDFDYTIPDSADQQGDIITSNEDDPNHFNPEYFGKGKTWKDPKLDRVLQNYKSAKRVYEAHGRKIYNATKGGKLELFERVEFDDMFTLE